MNTVKVASIVALSSLCLEAHPHENGMPVAIHAITAQGVGDDVGTLSFKDTAYGLLVTPDLHGLSAGAHALHLHEFPDCGPKPAAEGAVPGGAAGDHYDPAQKKAHRGPYADGHLGDLPNIIVEADGTSSIPVIAPRLKVADVRGHAVMLHAGADRYSDEDAKHQHHAQAAPGASKGGARMYCGVSGKL
ncbi:MAG TPA: superoxide dismutase family protein [Steroidobacteraceae bacterium]|nr:superoxide dismutase family protein [Steroidobacteraceae bacterium]